MIQNQLHADILQISTSEAAIYDKKLSCCRETMWLYLSLKPKNLAYGHNVIENGTVW